MPPDYGVIASLDNGAIDLILTFRTGSAYCCYESGCHLALSEEARWEQLRRGLTASRTLLPDRLTIQLTVVVEAGALFFDRSMPDPNRRGWYSFIPAEARRYQESLVEGHRNDIESSPGGT
jgi:hypothetical protein